MKDILQGIGLGFTEVILWSPSWPVKGSWAPGGSGGSSEDALRKCSGRYEAPKIQWRPQGALERPRCISPLFYRPVRCTDLREATEARKFRGDHWSMSWARVWIGMRLPEAQKRSQDALGCLRCISPFFTGIHRRAMYKKHE